MALAAGPPDGGLGFDRDIQNVIDRLQSSHGINGRLWKGQYDRAVIPLPVQC
jgi:hypothetical protein